MTHTTRLSVPLLLVLLVISGAAVGVAGEPKVITINPAVLKVAEQVEVPARDDGLLVSLSAREGQVVAAGELIAQLDDGDAQRAHTKAKLELQRGQKLATNTIKVRQATVELEQAKVDYRRALDALAKLPNSVSAAELDRLRSHGRKCTLDLEQAQFEIDAAQLAVSLLDNELQLASDRLQRRRLTTPLAGVVVALPKRPGEWVEAGQSVARIVATDRLRIEFFLKSSDAPPSLLGREVTFRLTGPQPTNESFSGRITLVGTEVDPVNNEVRMRAEVDNGAGHLRPGLAGTLTIGTGP